MSLKFFDLVVFSRNSMVFFPLSVSLQAKITVAPKNIYKNKSELLGNFSHIRKWKHLFKLRVIQHILKVRAKSPHISEWYILPLKWTNLNSYIRVKC